MSQTFAQSKTNIFDGIDYYSGKYGTPVLDGALASLECRVHTIHDCEDHYIIIGEVMEYCAKEGDPLVFFGGQYCRIKNAKELASSV